MPKEWHDRHAANKISDEDQKEFYRSIVADKKPYFMRYIYPSLMKDYNTYITNTNKNCLREFQLTIDELKSMPKNSLTERQREFLKFYNKKMPVGNSGCVMNKICRRFEQEFDGFVGRCSGNDTFNFDIMKSGSEYTALQFSAIKRLYNEYNKRIKNYAIFANSKKVDEYEYSAELSMINDDFKRSCLIVCQNESSLCDIVIDLCYNRNSTKKFAWSMCSDAIIHNLLRNNNNIISFPFIDVDGEFAYCGNTFSIANKKIGG